MKIRNSSAIVLFVSALMFGAPSLAFGQDDPEEAVEETGEQTEEAAEEMETAVAEEAEEAEEAAEEAAEEGEETAEETADEAEEDAEESEHGAYAWKPSYGGGLEGGVWFTELDRWNAHLLDRNDATPVDVSAVWHFDLVAEASLLEGTRLSLFGGIATPFADNPTVSAWYIGIEPAFAFRRDMWELAIGIGAGFGSTELELDSGASMDASLVVLRPFIEVRRYLNSWSGIYGRFGFNQWLVDDPEFEQLVFTQNGDPEGPPISDDNLNEGGPYLALGVRFGHYPEHVKVVGDSDGDGYRDDVDECPEEPEDFDDFEDEDGCPDPDNDGDGVLDGVDECPMTAEDIDGWEDDDGCPDLDNDGDGIPDTEDKCPDEAEDKDGWQDDDGCPDPDNDGDGILDVNDKCPDEAGVPEKDGCPFKRVEVTLKKIEIHEKIFFEKDKAVIKEQSHDLLNEIAQVLNNTPRIKKIEIQGHTSTEGKEAYNQKLSEQRANAVHDYLVEQGVDADRLTYKGYGESQLLVPLTDEGVETEEAKQKNRRVEFVILEQDEVKKTVREDEIPEEATSVEPQEEEEEEEEE